jgi:hypothetical protein
VAKPSRPQASAFDTTLALAISFMTLMVMAMLPNFFLLGLRLVSRSQPVSSVLSE